MSFAGRGSASSSSSSSASSASVRAEGEVDPYADAVRSGLRLKGAEVGGKKLRKKRRAAAAEAVEEAARAQEKDAQKRRAASSAAANREETSRKIHTEIAGNSSCDANLNPENHPLLTGHNKKIKLNTADKEGDGDKEEQKDREEEDEERKEEDEEREEEEEEREDREEEEEEEDDGMTPAERAFQVAQVRRQKKKVDERLRLTHRQRMERFNEHLSSLSEHFDIPKVGPG
eukprot:GHVT01011899.1.p1 GENE.GHVT01011899.1~~GHVT01011899.1.p1  ORF type:complete len:231 (+),score=89.33 GHVT01011899.1:1380-2072(+)